MNNKVVKIFGEGYVGGGVYDEIKIVGNGRVGDDIEAAEILLIGQGKFASVKGDKVSITGNAEINGNFTGHSFKASGKIKVRGEVNYDEVVLNGELEARTIDARRFFARGVVETESLKAQDIEITIYGRSQIDEIKAGTIEVANKGLWKMLQELVGGPGHVLEAESIEGDKIYLERTTAKSVKGNVVQIGPGCHIELVEFKDSVTTSPDSTVGRTVQRLN